jgi:membrane protein
MSTRAAAACNYRDMVSAARRLASDAAHSYSRHSGRMLASAVAFSSLLSIAPMLFIALGIASVAVGDARGRASVMQDLAHWIGDDGARTIFSILERTSAHRHGAAASILGGIVLLYAATRLFSQMKRALNHMWDVHAKSGRGFRGKAWKQLRKRGIALLLVAFVGVLIVAVVIARTVLATTDRLLGDTDALVVAHGGEMLVSVATTTVMFAALFKILPDARIAWRDAWRGALVTAVLFAIGTTIISLYLGHKTLDILYGPGGSLVLILLWVHYSAQVFFFGAAVTGELARRRGAAIEPDDNGVRVVIEEGL